MNNNSYCMSQIRKYAKAQILSWETAHTGIVIGLLIFLMCLAAAMGGFNLYMKAVLVILTALTLFGLYETLPAVFMYVSPYNSQVFDKDMTLAEKMCACDDIDSAVAEGRAERFHDMTSSAEYALLEGARTLRLISWGSIRRITKTAYPFRKKYKGVYFLNFIDNSGRKHVLDIHNGKDFNPLKQLDEILVYIEKAHPEIVIEMTQEDRDRINNRDELIVDKGDVKP